MKNLKIKSFDEFNFSLDGKVGGGCVDDVSGEFIISEKKNLWKKNNCSSIENDSLQLIRPLPEEFLEFNEDIFHLSCLACSTICVASKNHIFVFSSEDNYDSYQNLYLDQGMLALSWSPDGSVGVLITEDKTVHILSPSLEVMTSFELEQQGFGDAQLINVGWGKKETQFHGSEGKAAARKVIETVKSKADWDNGSPEIAWEPNGQAFAISWISETILFSETLSLGDFGHRQLRIFNVSGDLHATAVTVSGMEQGLTWRPNTHLIAATDRTPHGLRVIFYERNGLRHGEFVLADCLRQTTATNSQWFNCAESVKAGQMEFNPDGNLLAVQLIALQLPESIIRIYSTDNYHWYAKFHIPFPSVILHWSWSPIISSNEIIVAHGLDSESEETSRIVKYSWFRSTDVTCTVDGIAQTGFIAVIDKDNLLCTPLSSMVVPPPMCGFTLNCSQPINFVGVPNVIFDGSSFLLTNNDTIVPVLIQFSDHNLSCVVVSVPISQLNANTLQQNNDQTEINFNVNDEIKITASFNIATAGGKGFRPRCLLPTRASDVIHWTNATAPNNGLILHSQWIDASHVLLLFSNNRFCLCFQNDNQWMMREISKGLPFSKMLTFAIGPEQRQLYILLSTGQISLCSLTNDFEVSENHILDMQMTFCPFNGNMNVLHLLSKSTNFDDLPALVYLDSSTYRLYLGGVLASSSLLFTSIAFHPDFLLLTTLQHQLLLIPLHNKTVKDLIQEFNQIEIRQQQQQQQQQHQESIIKSNNNQQRHFYCENIRAIEQGGVIVTVIPQDCKVILSMPRGNLETIYPRALVLCELRRLLDSVENNSQVAQIAFSKTLELARRHRVNMNLLHDHKPELFLSNLTDFILGVDNVERLNLFIADLSNEDVTKTMYSQFYQEFLSNNVKLTLSSTAVGGGGGNKQDKICDALIKAFCHVDEKKYILSIVTCYAKKTTKEADNALILLKSYRDKGDDNVWQKGLRHLQYLIDKETLFQLALGTYDLSLTIAVAELSQLDPREYVPYLSQLERITSIDYRSYKIDVHLKRPQKALEHLLLCTTTGTNETCTFKECLDFIQQHHLYGQALEYYSPQSQQHMQIGDLFAKWLIQEKRLKEAATVYERSGLFKDAASCFFRLNEWRRWYLCALQVPMDQNTILLEANLLADRLITVGRWQDSCDILVQIVKDHGKAVNLLLDHFSWMQAELLQSQFLPMSRDEFELKIRYKITEYCDQLTNDINKNSKTFAQRVERIKTLRSKHRTDYAMAGDRKHFEMDDAFSDTSSIFSGSIASLSSGTSRLSQVTSSSKGSGRSAKQRRKAERKKWTTREGSSLEEVALMEECFNFIVSGQTLAKSTTECMENALLKTSDMKSIRSLRAAVNEMLFIHKQAISLLWDDFITGKVIMEYGSISAAVAGQEYVGRHYYDVHEHFLRFPPEMKINKVDSKLI